MWWWDTIEDCSEKKGDRDGFIFSVLVLDMQDRATTVHIALVVIQELPGENLSIYFGKWFS